MILVGLVGFGQIGQLDPMAPPPHMHIPPS